MFVSVTLTLEPVVGKNYYPETHGQRNIRVTTVCLPAHLSTCPEGGLNSWVGGRRLPGPRRLELRHADLQLPALTTILGSTLYGSPHCFAPYFSSHYAYVKTCIRFISKQRLNQTPQPNYFIFLRCRQQKRWKAMKSCKKKTKLVLHMERCIILDKHGAEKLRCCSHPCSPL